MGALVRSESDGFADEIALEGDAVGDDAHLDDGAFLAVEIEACELLRGDVHGCGFEALHFGFLRGGGDDARHNE